MNSCSESKGLRNVARHPSRRIEAAHSTDAASGFSLVELMIVLAIIAILAALAYPSYMKHVITTNRSAAEGCLSEYSNYMERYYTTNLSYSQQPASGSTAAVANTLPTLDCATQAQTGSNYQYSFNPAVAATSYTVQAQPSSTFQQKDTQCGTLTINQLGQRGINGTSTVALCW